MAIYKENYKYIEIYFEEFPDENIRELLKLYKWRWYDYKKCWSNFNNEENLQFAKSLCQSLTPSVKEENKLKRLERIQLSIANVVIRSNSFYCNSKHELIDYAGEIEVCDIKGNIRTCVIPVAYCINCDLFYVLEDTFQELKKKGTILCQIMTKKEYSETGRYSMDNLHWKKHSPLWIMGYNVNQNEGLSSVQRQQILSEILDKGIMKKDLILSYLDFFVKYHATNADAIYKWKQDRQYLANYKINSKQKMKIGGFVWID